MANGTGMGADSTQGGLTQGDYLSMIGGAATGLTSFYQPFISQHWASAASRKERHWAEFMAKHRYQFAVKDLRKAGLNPALAYTQGGASSPGYNQQVAEFDVDGSAIGRAVSSAYEAQRAHQDLKIARDEVYRSSIANENAREEAFGVKADVAARSAQAKIAERNRDVANATSAASIAEANARAAALMTEANAAAVELDKQRAMLPAAKQMAEWLATPDGMRVQKAERVLGVAREGIGALTGARQLVKQPEPYTETETTEGYDAAGRPSGASVKTRKGKR